MCTITAGHKTGKAHNYAAIALLFFLILAVGVVAVRASRAYAAGPEGALQIEGEYYGKETVAFSLLRAKDRFVKSYSNGVTIVGKKTSRGPIYYFVKNEGKLIIKVSQDNLYRIGEASNWETMTGLTRFPGDARLVKENKVDAAHACQWYKSDKGKVRLCMNEEFRLPVYIEEKGRMVAYVKKMSSTKMSVDPEKVISGFLKNDYRFVNADEDISPDTDWPVFRACFPTILTIAPH
jgi:hypothetical protein